MHPEEVARVAAFDWDDANRIKCEQHGVSRATIEALFRQPIATFPDPAHSRAETRFKAIGRTDAGAMCVHVADLWRRDIHPPDQRALHARKGDQIL